MLKYSVGSYEIILIKEIKLSGKDIVLSKALSSVGQSIRINLIRIFKAEIYLSSASWIRFEGTQISRRKIDLKNSYPKIEKHVGEQILPKNL